MTRPSLISKEKKNLLSVHASNVYPLSVLQKLAKSVQRHQESRRHADV